MSPTAIAGKGVPVTGANRGLGKALIDPEPRCPPPSLLRTAVPSHNRQDNRMFR